MLPLLDVKCTPDTPEGADLTARLVVATMGVVDKDDDILAPGSVGRQECFAGPWGHTIARGACPIGRAGLHEDGDKLIADVKFWGGIQSAVETWISLREGSDLAEVSFGLLPMKWSWNQDYVRVIEQMDVFEVSPVLRGAGVGTGVLSVKEAKELSLAEYKASQMAEQEPEPDLAAETKELSFVPTPGLIRAIAWYRR